MTTNGNGALIQEFLCSRFINWLCLEDYQLKPIQVVHELSPLEYGYPIYTKFNFTSSWYDTRYTTSMTYSLWQVLYGILVHTRIYVYSITYE